MYNFVTNKDVIHEHKRIRELIYTILKMMIVEKFKKPKLQFPINQPYLSYVYEFTIRCIF